MVDDEFVKQLSDDSAHEVADRNVGRYLDEHVDMLSGQNA
jgi:hypothetical protein